MSLATVSLCGSEAVPCPSELMLCTDTVGKDASVTDAVWPRANVTVVHRLPDCGRARLSGCFFTFLWTAVAELSRLHYPKLIISAHCRSLRSREAPRDQAEDSKALSMRSMVRACPRRAVNPARRIQPLPGLRCLLRAQLLQRPGYSDRRACTCSGGGCGGAHGWSVGS